MPVEEPIGTLWLDSGNTLPAIIEITEAGAVYVKNECNTRFFSMTREQVIEFNKLWIENELNIPHDKSRYSKGVQG